MKNFNVFLSALLLVGILGPTLPAVGAEGVVVKERVPGTNYCHLKFPEIREETLTWDQPVLEDPKTTALIDFYGPCDHDPLGQEEVQIQKEDLENRRRDDQGDG